jgi:hypothetical protein
MSISVLNTDANLTAKTLLAAENADTITGLKTFDRDPNPPFAVSSGSAKVDNLDADKVDGLHSTDIILDTDATAAAVSYAGGNFTSDAGTWTVESGDVLSNAYVKLNRLLLWSVGLTTTSIASATPTYLKIVLPAGTTIDKRSDGAFVYTNNGGASSVGLWVAVAGDAFIRLYRDEAATVWALGTNNNSMHGLFTLFTTA